VFVGPDAALVVAGREDVGPLGVTNTTLVTGASADVEVVVTETVDVGDDEVVGRLEVGERVLLVVGSVLLEVVRELVTADVVGEETLEVVVGGAAVEGLDVGLVVGESLVVGDVDTVGESVGTEDVATSEGASELVSVLVIMMTGVEVTTMVAVVVDGVSSREETMLESLLNVCAAAPANMADVTANCLQTMLSLCDVMLVSRKVSGKVQYLHAASVYTEWRARNSVARQNGSLVMRCSRIARDVAVDVVP
jgi:hypothetical protein